jgi:hypothetical protein
MQIQEKNSKILGSDDIFQKRYGIQESRFLWITFLKEWNLVQNQPQIEDHVSEKFPKYYNNNPHKQPELVTP